jgi:hypothetical protein
MIEMMIRQGSLLSIIRTHVRQPTILSYALLPLSHSAREEKQRRQEKKACRSAPSARPLARPLSASSGWLRSKWTLLSSGSAA